MFREMRRHLQYLPAEVIEEILHTATSGVLSVSGDDGYPYGVPISFAYRDGKIYFHCAQSGHKLDAIQRSDKVSFCVIDADDVHLAEYTTYFRSVIAFGRARVLDTPAEKIAAMEILMEKYPAPVPPEVVRKKIEDDLSHYAMVEITIEHCTGKEQKNLAKARRQQ